MRTLPLLFLAACASLEPDDEAHIRQIGDVDPALLFEAGPREQGPLPGAPDQFRPAPDAAVGPRPDASRPPPDASRPPHPDAFQPPPPDAFQPPPPDAAAPPADELAFCVAETNRYRAMVQRGPVAQSEALEAYAAEGARNDHSSGVPHQHFAQTNGGGVAFAENACPGFLGWRVNGTVQQTVADCLAAFWSEGPGGGHYENMIGNYGTLGCGIFLDGAGGITIIQDFGF